MEISSYRKRVLVNSSSSFSVTKFPALAVRYVVRNSLFLDAHDIRQRAWLHHGGILLQ
jgi:hypothetical protein